MKACIICVKFPLKIRWNLNYVFSFIHLPKKKEYKNYDLKQSYLSRIIKKKWNKYMSSQVSFCIVLWLFLYLHNMLCMKYYSKFVNFPNSRYCSRQFLFTGIKISIFNTRYGKWEYRTVNHCGSVIIIYTKLILF